MTSTVGLWATFANVVFLLALAAIVFGASLSPLARLAASVFASVCAWLTTAAFDEMGAPIGAILTGTAVLVVCIAAAVWTLHRWTQTGGAAQIQPGPGDDPDGGGLTVAMETSP